MITFGCWVSESSQSAPFPCSAWNRPAFMAWPRTYQLMRMMWTRCRSSCVCVPACLCSAAVPRVLHRTDSRARTQLFSAELSPQPETVPCLLCASPGSFPAWTMNIWQCFTTSWTWRVKATFVMTRSVSWGYRDDSVVKSKHWVQVPRPIRGITIACDSSTGIWLFCLDSKHLHLHTHMSTQLQIIKIDL